MENSHLQEQAVKAMVLINAAIRNIRLYPASSSSSVSSIDKAYQKVKDIIDEYDELSYAESERSLLVCNNSLDEKEQKRPQVLSFLELLLGFGIKSLEIRQGVTRNEFGTFLEILSQKSEELNKNGGLKNILINKKFSHISVDHKVFVALDKDYQVTGKDENKKNFSKAKITKESFSSMITFLDEVLDPQMKEDVAYKLATSLSIKEDDFLTYILSQELSGEFGKLLFDNLLNELNNQEFERVLHKIKDSIKDESPESEGLKIAYQNILASEKGNYLRAKIKDKKEDDISQKEKQRAHIKAGLNSILKGEKNVFEDKQIMQSLSGTIDLLLAQKKDKTVELILDKLGEGPSIEKPNIRYLISESITDIGEVLISRRFFDISYKLSRQLVEWIKIENTLTAPYEKACAQLQKLARYLILNDYFPKAVHILDAFNLIYGKKIPKNEQIVNLVGEILNEIGTDDLLDPIFDEFQSNRNNGRQQAIENLVKLGAASVNKLLELLQNSEDRYERSRVLRTISDIGNSALPALIEHIQTGNPRYFIRNLVLLFGRIGNKSHIGLLTPFLDYKDFRVQREALNSIYNIGGKQTEDILLATFPKADDRLKLDIIGILTNIKSTKAIPIFEKILSTNTLQLTKTGHKIAEKICLFLGSTASYDVIPTLTEILSQQYTEPVKAAALKALEEISSRQSLDLGPYEASFKTNPNFIINDEIDPSSLKNQPFGSTDELSEEELVDKYLDDNNLQSAVGLLFDLIIKNAKEKEFLKADALRDRLVDVDPMALTQIYNAGEIINQEKTRSLDISYIKKWSNIYSSFTKDEINVIYYSLRESKYSKGTSIFKQGQINSKLYFIDNGVLSLTYDKKRDNVVIKTISEGEIVGYDTFFTLSTCTNSLTAVSDVSLRFLDKEILKKWKVEYPAIEPKIKAYCLKLEQISDLLSKNGLDRRLDARVSKQGKLIAQILDSSGKNKGNPVKGEVVDVSYGGISFATKLPKEILRSAILNNSVSLQLSVQGMKSQSKMGHIVAVSDLVSSDLSIDHCLHIKFTD